MSHRSPVKDLFVLLGGLLGIILSIYIVLGFAVNHVVTSLPVEVEESLGILFSSMYSEETKGPEAKELQKLLDQLLLEIPPDDKDLPGKDRYRVHLVDDDMVNAMALPGGHIVVFSGLIKQMNSENELSFVLAHELGHFANKDHLRGLGRSLVLLTISTALLGTDNPATNFIMNSLVGVEMKFSRDQETMADMWALDLLNKRYGHVSGATDFFNKLSIEENDRPVLNYFSTHPYPGKRVEELQERIREKGYELKGKEKLNKV